MFTKFKFVLEIRRSNFEVLLTAIFKWLISKTTVNGRDLGIYLQVNVRLSRILECIYKYIYIYIGVKLDLNVKLKITVKSW